MGDPKVESIEAMKRYRESLQKELDTVDRSLAILVGDSIAIDEEVNAKPAASHANGKSLPETCLEILQSQVGTQFTVGQVKEAVEKSGFKIGGKAKTSIVTNSLGRLYAKGTIKRSKRNGAWVYSVQPESYPVVEGTS